MTSWKQILKGLSPKVQYTIGVTIWGGLTAAEYFLMRYLLSSNDSYKSNDLEVYGSTASLSFITLIIPLIVIKQRNRCTPTVTVNDVQPYEVPRLRPMTPDLTGLPPLELPPCVLSVATDHVIHSLELNELSGGKIVDDKAYSRSLFNVGP